jgi:hypothetical protein
MILIETLAQMLPTFRARKIGTGMAKQNGPLKAARVSIEFNSISFFYYFFGVSTGVGTLSMTEDEPRMLVI